MLSQQRVGTIIVNDARTMETINIIRSKKGFAEVAQMNFVAFVEGIDKGCAAVCAPSEATAEPLHLMMAHASQGNQLINNLDSSLTLLNCMIDTQQNVKEIDDAFNVIADNQFELLKKHMAEREEKNLDVLPAVDYDEALTFLAGGNAVIKVNTPEKFKSAGEKEFFYKVMEKHELNLKIIRRCKEIHAQLTVTLPKQKQTWEQMRERMRQLQSTVVALLDSAANQANVSPKVIVANQKLSTLPQALHGNNSHAVQKQRQQNVRQEQAPAKKSKGCWPFCS